MKVEIIGVASQAFERWPALRRPKPLKPPKRWQTGLIDSDVEYSKLVEKVRAGTFRLRNPARKTKDLAGPVPLRGGYSMAGILARGDHLWFDPSARATDGDIVATHESDAFMQTQVDWMERNPHVAEAYDWEAPNCAVHVLRYIGRKPHILSARLLPGGKILGVMAELSAEQTVLGPCRYITRHGVPIYGCRIDCIESAAMIQRVPR